MKRIPVAATFGGVNEALRRTFDQGLRLNKLRSTAKRFFRRK